MGKNFYESETYKWIGITVFCAIIVIGYILTK